MASERWPGFDRKAEIAWVRQHRKSMLPNLVKGEKRRLGERIAATRKLFRRRLLIGDLHTHTVFSDGLSTIRENWEIAQVLGFDFLVISDHRTVRQKRYCDVDNGLWWGQEPPTKDMEVGLFMPPHLFVPKCDNMPTDFERARKRAPFVWVPHPAGYGSGSGYPDAVVENLWRIGGRFAMEVLHGNSRIFSAYNPISARAVRVWDQLLRDGRRVTALGSSDAHLCSVIGTAWTGVYAPERRPGTVAQALNRGRTFASEAPLLWLSCGRAMMGDEIRRKPGAKMKIRYSAADSIGLHSVRLIAEGKVIKKVAGKDAPKISRVLDFAVPRKPIAVRLECTAADQRRAFSSPIFIRPR